MTLVVLSPVLTWCHQRHSATLSLQTLRRVERDLGPVPRASFILTLSTIFILCYSLNMIISELYITDSFYFVLIKVVMLLNYVINH